MSADRYGFEVSAWVEPKYYAALRDDVNRAIAEAIAAEHLRTLMFAAKIARERDDVRTAEALEAVAASACG